MTDALGNIKEKLAYDPWGLRRNPENWAELDNGKSFLFSRGYTMHEHLDDFRLINMSGRVYDPVMAQFLSPDPFIQAPGNWYNYNRYGYCLNNPLLFSDLSGYTWGIFKPFVKFGNWVKKSFDNLGDWMNKHDLSFMVGTNMTPLGGSRTYNASINGQEVFNSANISQFNPAVNVERGLNQMRSSYGLYIDNLNSLDLAVDQGIRSSVSMGGAANFGIAEIDAYSGAATKVIYDAIPGGYWKDGMPIEVNYGNDILVVDNTNNAYRSIDDPIFTKRHRAYWNINYIAASYTYPIKNFEAMEKGLHGWAQFAAPNTKFPYFFPLPDDFQKSVNDYSNYYEARERKKKFYYYRKAGIIY